MWLVFLLLVLVGVFVVLGLAAVAAVVALLHVLPWLLILAGIWLLLRATRGSGRNQQADTTSRPEPRPASRPAPPRSARQHASEHRADRRRQRELPIDVRVTVEQITRKADMLLGYADRFPPFSHDLHIVRQTAAEYLPRTVATYLALPGDDDPVVPGTDRSALQELREQLRVLDAKLDAITQNLQRNDLDRLVANRRFLEERFQPQDRGPQVEAPGRETDAA